MAIIVPAQQTTIANLYTALFNRAPDATGFGFWVQALSNGASLSTITQGFLSSPESKAIYPSAQTSEQFITTFYTTVFGRAPDAAGLAFWAGVVNANGGSSSDAARSIAVSQIINVVSTPLTTKPADITDAQYAQTVADRGTFMNKSTVGVYYAVEAKGTNLDVAKQILTGVNATDASVTAAKAIADSNAGGGTSFVLTDSTDVLAGTSGNDTFIAGLKAGAATLTAGDTITGGSGIDRINLFGNDNATAFKSANITGVELVYAQLAASTDLDVSATAGVTQAWIANGSTGANTITLAKTQTAGLQGTIAGASTFTFTAATGAADVATLALDGATAAGVTIAGIETLNVTSTGTNSIGTLTAAAATTLNVTGAGKLTATVATGALKTVDASANTGGVTLDLSGVAVADLKVTGTAVADEVTIDFGALTKADVINLGAGTDTLGFSANNVTINSTTIGQFAGVTNVEAFKFNGTIDATVDAAQTAVNSFGINTTGALAFSNLQNTDTVAFGAITTNAASTLGMELGSSTAALSLTGSGTAISSVTGLTVTGSSIINVASAGATTVGNNVLGLTVASNNAINVTGAKDLTLTVTAAGGATTGEKIDASAFTGKLAVTGTVQSDIIIGGTGNDTINAGAVTHAAGAALATTEIATLTAQASGLNAGEAITVAGLTFTAGGTPLTQAQVAAIYAGLADGATNGLSVLGTYSGALAGYNTSAVASNAVTFTATTSGVKTDLAATGTGAAAVTPAVTTQGAAASGAITGTTDTLTGGAGADTFVFSTADVDSAAGQVTAVITDFVTGTDKIQVTNGGAGAGSATTFVKAAAVAADLATLLTAADTALAGAVKYYVGQVGADSYLVTDGDGIGYTNVIKLTGVALTGIVEADLIAAPI